MRLTKEGFFEVDMSKKTRTRLGAAALTLGLAALYIVILLTVLHAVGTDEALYYSEQMKAGVLPAAGITEGELRELDGRLADYLRGDAAALQAGAPFNDREMAHMADCLGLFRLLRRVRGRLIPWAIALTLGGAWLMQERRRARLCAWLSPFLVLIPLGAFALYAALDFGGAFTLFLRLLFKNDLWLLNPATDLLIRICPEGMFMHMGLRVAAFSLAGMLAVSAAATLLTFIWPKGKEANTWKSTTRRGPAPKRIDFVRKGTR